MDKRLKLPEKDVAGEATNAVPEQGDKSSRQLNSGHPNQPKYADSLAFGWWGKLL